MKNLRNLWTGIQANGVDLHFSRRCKKMTDTYITENGDKWDSIALKVYGDETKADWIMDNNLFYVSVFEFSAGTVLKTPALTDEKSGNLPPWR